MIDDFFSSTKTFRLTSETPFHLETHNYIKIQQFSLIDDRQEFTGERLIIYVTINTVSKSGKELDTKTPVSSFIIGKDYEQSANIILSPKDNATITVEGPNIPIQILYSEYDN